MFGFSAKRLVVVTSLAVASTGASGSAAHALLDNGANFSITVPVNVAVPIGVCSAQSIGFANNVNRGDVDRSDAKTWTDSEARCDVLNNLLRNVSDVLNGNISGNLAGNLSDNLNHSIDHLLNNNLRGLFNRGSLITL